jgi:hypothetical protein
MLCSISWQQYFAVVLLSGIAWYTYVGLTCYRHELAAFFKNKAKADNPLQLTGQITIVPVMGAVRPEESSSSHDPEELIFGASSPDDISEATLPKGPAGDLLAEAKMLVYAFAENGTKSEFLSLLNLLLGQYEIFRDEISLEMIIGGIRSLAMDNLPFEISKEEWDLKWPETAEV